MNLRLKSGSCKRESKSQFEVEVTKTEVHTFSVPCAPAYSIDTPADFYLKIYIHLIVNEVT